MPALGRQPAERRFARHRDRLWYRTVTMITRGGSTSRRLSPAATGEDSAMGCDLVRHAGVDGC
jgi:hypothetical protein